MSRTAIAVPLGLLGFLLYVGAVVALADHVLALHWTVQTAYFVLAGIAWAWPGGAGGPSAVACHAPPSPS